MSVPQPPQPAKLVVSVLMKDHRLLEPVSIALCGLFGPVEMVSPWYAFGFTDYYEAELGAPLNRRLLVFQNFIDQIALARIKLQTNAVEKRFFREGKRSVNLDPGYLLPERFVLATGKNYSHRIYLDNGIYADLTLIFQDGDYSPLAWTYPDYRQPELRGFLGKVRWSASW